jgi:hypothetical protein
LNYRRIDRYINPCDDPRQRLQLQQPQPTANSAAAAIRYNDLQSAVKSVRMKQEQLIVLIKLNNSENQE